MKDSTKDYQDRYANPNLTGGDIKLSLASERYGDPRTEKTLVPLTNEETAEMRAAYAENGIARTRLEKEKKAKMDAFKLQIDPIRDEEKRQVEALEIGAVLRIVTLYDIDDQETGMMITYTEEGRFVSARPLKGAERQHRMPLTVGPRNPHND